MGDGVEPGREAAELDSGGQCREGGDERVASSGVHGTHVTEMAVEATGLNQGGKRQLLEGCGSSEGTSGLA